MHINYFIYNCFIHLCKIELIAMGSDMARHVLLPQPSETDLALIILVGNEDAVVDVILGAIPLTVVTPGAAANVLPQALSGHEIGLQAF